MRKNFSEFFKTTFWVIKIYWKISPILLIIILVTQCFLQLETIVYSYVFGVALDRVIVLIALKTVDLTLTLPVIVLFVGILFVSHFIQLVNNRASAILDTRDTWMLRKILSDHLIALGISQLEDPDLTNKTTRFTELLGGIDQHLQGIISIIGYFVTTVAAGLILFHATPLLIPFFIGFFFIKFVVNQRYIAKIWRFFKYSTENRRKASTDISLLSDPTYLKELVITKGFKYLNKKYNEFVFWHAREFRIIHTSWAKAEFLEDVGDAVLYAIGLYLIIRQGVAGVITIGTITFLIRTVGTFSDDLDTLTYRISRVRESAIRIKDAQDIFNDYKAEVDGKTVLDGSSYPPQIEASNVSFRYPNSKRYILKDLTLKIGSGEKIAIVGENGAGKTTLVKLLARIYKVNAGEVRLNGININDIEIDTWHERLGLLFQDYNTYGHLDVSENVGIGRIDQNGISDIRVDKALRSAQAMSFVEKYPKKLKQILSERYKGGIRPSTGQWQKIAIARFFYRNAPVLILDEPTASIDAVSEAQIFDSIYKFMKDRTVIIISHRFSTVRNADRILVLDKGRIIEEGSHEELLKKKGKYAHAFKLQARGYE